MGPLHEFLLHDEDGEFVRAVPCVPPFDEAPEIAIDGERYYVLMQDMTYQEAVGVTWIPEIEVGPGSESRPG